MSQKNDILAAIDIGTTKIVAIVGRRVHNNKIEVLGVGRSKSSGVKRGVVLNIEETAAAIQKAVSEAEKMSDIKFKDVYVGIAGQHIRSTRNRGYRHIENPYNEITTADVEALRTDMYNIPIEAGEEIIHVIPQSYTVDKEIGVKQPVGMAGKRLEANFHIVIGQSTSATNITKCINRCGLNVIKMILEPLASAESVLTEDEKEAGVALVDIGGGTTDIAVFSDGVIRHTAVIPFGGHVVTRDIREGCSILSRYAEALKVQYGSALGEYAPDDKVVTIPGVSGRAPKEISFKSLAHIIQARMEEIIDGVYYEIEASGYLNKLGAGIALTGGGALLKHLPVLVKYRTSLDVRLGMPSEYKIDKLPEDVKEPMFSTVLGLLLKGYQHRDKSAKQEKIENLQSEETTPDAETEKEEPEVKQEATEIKKPKKGNFFSTLKNTLLDIFEDKDSAM